MSMRLGDYVFDWEPDKMSIPQKSKPYGEVNTYTGKAIFQWTTQLQGEEIVLEWGDLCPVKQYEQLKLKYLSTDTFEFNPDTGGNSYTVIVKSLDPGDYVRGILHDQPYRSNVKMVLSIRAQASTTSTTTTSSSTTSTTV